MLLRTAPAVLVLLLATAVRAQTAALEPAFPGLSFVAPIEIVPTADGTDRLLVAEKAGRILAIDHDRAATTTALDIRSLVRDSGEQGFLGMALHPDFASNGYLYVHYTGKSNGGNGTTVLERYTRSVANPDVFDPASQLVLLSIPQPYVNHNGGKLTFGPDGYLYLGLGDGGYGGDPGNRAQDRSVLFGKLLRLDVDAPPGGLNYGIPADNPFAGNADGFREEIYAYGFRNPFKFSFDRETDALWLADVGQNAYEEVDLVTKGGNYGWRIREGTHCFNPSSGCTTSGLTDPIYEYDHPNLASRSVTGGVVYRGARNPDLVGTYLFGDYIIGDIWGLTYDGTTATRRTIASAGSSLIAFAEDDRGEVLMLFEDGRVLRFVAAATAAEALAPPPAPALRVVSANPFAGRAVVELAPAASGRSRVTVTDALGRRVAVLLDGAVAAGERRRLVLDGAGLAPGVYLVRLDAEDGTQATLRLVHAR